MPWRCYRKVYNQVVAGLQCMWDRGWIHNDVKAGNIFYERIGQDGCPEGVVLADFGLSRQIGHSIRPFDEEDYMSAYYVVESLFYGMEDPLKIRKSFEKKNGGGSVVRAAADKKIDLCSFAYMIDSIWGKAERTLQKILGPGHVELCQVLLRFPVFASELQWPDHFGRTVLGVGTEETPEDWLSAAEVAERQRRLRLQMAEAALGARLVCLPWFSLPLAGRVNRSNWVAPSATSDVTKWATAGTQNGPGEHAGKLLQKATRLAAWTGAEPELKEEAPSQKKVVLPSGPRNRAGSPVRRRELAKAAAKEATRAAEASQFLASLEALRPLGRQLESLREAGTAPTTTAQPVQPPQPAQPANAGSKERTATDIPAELPARTAEEKEVVKDAKELKEAPEVIPDEKEPSRRQLSEPKVVTKQEDLELEARGSVQEVELVQSEPPRRRPDPEPHLDLVDPAKEAEELVQSEPPRRPSDAKPSRSSTVADGEEAPPEKMLTSPPPAPSGETKADETLSKAKARAERRRHRPAGNAFNGTLKVQPRNAAEEKLEKEEADTTAPPAAAENAPKRKAKAKAPSKPVKSTMIGVGAAQFRV
ncbi:unnamed protein product [Durusdinium trenchii]|uniref:Protein kinase domain-containing protein n=1 Tax=Durusdinium trenchii TaxID=1381693 RepID=A0ABP0IS64_9DINO